MLFLQFILYSSSFVGTLKNEIPGAALELCQLKLKQFSPDILKFSTKHEDNPFTLNCFMVPRTFLFIFHAGSCRLGSNNVRNSSYKAKMAGSTSVFRLSFRFLWLWLNLYHRSALILRNVACPEKLLVTRLVFFFLFKATMTGAEKQVHVIFKNCLKLCLFLSFKN